MEVFQGFSNGKKEITIVTGDLTQDTGQRELLLGRQEGLMGSGQGGGQGLLQKKFGAVDFTGLRYPMLSGLAEKMISESPLGINMQLGLKVIVDEDIAKRAVSIDGGISGVAASCQRLPEKAADAGMDGGADGEIALHAGARLFHQRPEDRSRRARARPLRQEGADAMTARDDEITAIGKLLSSGKTSSIIFTGESGTGKSDLFKNLSEMMERQDTSDRVQSLQNMQVILTGNIANAANAASSADVMEAFRNSANAMLSPALLSRFTDPQIQPMSEAMRRKVTGKLVDSHIRQKGIPEEDFADAHSFVVGKVTAAFNAEEGLRGLSNTISKVFESGGFAEFISHGTPSGRRHRGTVVAEGRQQGRQHEHRSARARIVPPPHGDGMSRNSVTFTALAGSARAEDIAFRVNDMISVLPGSEAFFLERFAAIHKAKKMLFDHSEEGAKLDLKETIEAARGERGIGLQLRRFLTSPAVRGLLDEQFPAYEAALLAKNAGAVAEVVASAVGHIADTPAKAAFKTRRP